jgi:hypothetical protein
MQSHSIPIKSEFARIQRASALAEGIELVLQGRGLAVSDEQHERLSTTADLELLKTWLRRAGTVATVEELFV